MMMRLLFNSAAGASLVLFVVLVALWVRSYWVLDGWAHQPTGVPKNVAAQFHVLSAWGRIEYRLDRRTYVSAVSVRRMPSPRYGSSSLSDGRYPRPTRGFLGFRYEDRTTQQTGQRTATTHTVIVTVPHACLAALAATIPAWWVVRDRRRRRAPGGFPVDASPTAVPPPPHNPPMQRTGGSGTL